MTTFRTALVAVALTAALLVPAASAASTHSTSARTERIPSLEVSVLAQLNAVRSAHGLTLLRLSKPLSSAATQHSAEMAVDGYFAHNSFDNTSFWKRLQRYYPATHRSYWSVGENLLWSGGPVNGAGAVKLWMASPEHRRNILAPQWRQIGISAIQAASAPGVFAGLDATLITTDFGVRR